MTTGLQHSEGPTQADLIALLDPARSYGERSYDDVVRQVVDGQLILYPGYNLPVIRDAATNLAVKGTGKPLGQTGPQQAALQQFRLRGIDHVDEVLDGILAGIRRGDDWHWHSLFLQYQVGKVGEVRDGGEMAAVLLRMLEMFEKPETRTVVIDG